MGPVCGSHYVVLCCFNLPCPVYSCLYCSRDWNFVLLSVVPLVTQMVKNLPVMWETQVRSLGWENPLEKGMETHSSNLVRELHEQRSLLGYSPWGCKESDISEQLTLSLFYSS